MADSSKANRILEATKIQARAVIPIVKALEKELGKERAHAIVGEAIADNYVAWRTKLGFETNGHPGAKDDNQPEFPVCYEVVEHTDSSYGHDITGLRLCGLFPVDRRTRNRRVDDLWRGFRGRSTDPAGLGISAHPDPDARCALL